MIVLGEKQIQQRKEKEDLEDQLRSSFIFRPPRFTVVFVNGEEIDMFNDSDRDEESMRSLVRKRIEGK